MRALRAFLLGTVAVGLLAYVTAAVVALAAAAAGAELAARAGPAVVVAVERDASGATSLTFGLALVLVALAGGALNLVAATILGRRQGGRRDGVH